MTQTQAVSFCTNKENSRALAVLLVYVRLQNNGNGLGTTVSKLFQRYE